MKPFSKQTIGVFGLGLAGRAAVEALLAAGAEVFAWDDKQTSLPPCGGVEERSDSVGGKSGDKTPHGVASATPAPPQGGSVRYVPPTEWPWASIKTLVLSPGIPLTHPKPHAVVDLAKKAGAEIICDVEILYRLAPEATYVGITGTNGKSTTTALTGHILKSAGKNVQVGGNIGTAATALPRLGKDGIYVLELSSYQLDLINTAHFHISVLLNITPDHIDRHGDMEGYIRAKMRLFGLQREGDKAVIAVDDDYTKHIAREFNMSKAEVIPVSADTPPEGISPTAFKRLPGRHNVQNIVAAYNVALQLGVPHKKILAAIATFPGLDHRLQLIAEKDGIAFINDSKATNAVATEQALSAFTSPRLRGEVGGGDEAEDAPSQPSPASGRGLYWILGGLSKEGGIESLSAYFPRVKHAFLIGKAAEEFAKTLEGKVPYTQCGTLENAFAKAATLAKMDGGGTVLLSPACASFDQFKSFEHRGDVFAKLAREWQNST